MHVLYLSACQQWLGQACDLWPLAVKLTLPPVGCCAKCQERPLILSCCLAGHSAADYLSCPDQCTDIPCSAQICYRLSCTETRPPTYSSRTNRHPTVTKWVLFFSWNFPPSKWVKIRIVKSCRRDGKVLRRGETWHCQDSSVCVCACLTSVFSGPGGLYRGLVKDKESPMAISVTEHNRSTFPENFVQWNWVWSVGVTSLKH